MENVDTTKKKLLNSWILVVSIALIVRAAGNIFLPSISYMAKDLNVDEAVATSNLNLYYIILAICYILLGPVCDRFQKSLLLRLGLVVCIAGCAMAAVAPNIHVLNIGRSIQALAAGLCMLSSQLWISEHSDKKNMMAQLAWFSMVAALAPLLAPFLGGFIADWLSWRYDFWLIALLGIPVYFFTSNLKRMDSQSQNKKKSISIKNVCNNYKNVLLGSPLEKMSVSVQALFWGQSCFITISSFLFINEFGISATQLGLLNFLFVAGLFAGRFPVVYLQKKYSYVCGHAGVLLYRWQPRLDRDCGDLFLAEHSFWRSSDSWRAQLYRGGRREQRVGYRLFPFLHSVFLMAGSGFRTVPLQSGFLVGNDSAISDGYCIAPFAGWTGVFPSLLFTAQGFN